MDDILECDFKSFKLVLFDVKWYTLQMNECDPNRIVIEHDNGFTMVNIRSCDLGTYCSILPIQCQHVFYSKIPSRGGWSFVVRYYPRGRPIKYNVVEEDDI